MMDVTDRHCRNFLRQITKEALLYTEMVTTGALIHGDRERFLRHEAEELPLALQLGGSDPTELASCARMGEDRGYSEINLNVGCPSDRVQHNMIGACLMAHPQLVADCVASMRKAVQIPVTVKSRIGIDGMDSDEELAAFITSVAAAGCKTFILHARIAVLAGLTPKENREIPPLNYPRVYRMKQRFPELEFIINGGIRTINECETHLQHVDGVMLGREAWHNPWILHDVDKRLFNSGWQAGSRTEVLLAYLPYLEQQLASGLALHHITRHILGLFQGQPGGRRFRRHLSEHAHRPDASIEVVKEALAFTGNRPLRNNSEIREGEYTC